MSEKAVAPFTSVEASAALKIVRQAITKPFDGSRPLGWRIAGTEILGSGYNGHRGHLCITVSLPGSEGAVCRYLLIDPEDFRSNTLAARIHPDALLSSMPAREEKVSSLVALQTAKHPKKRDRRKGRKGPQATPGSGGNG